MELLALLFPSFCFLTLSGRTFAAESGTPVTTVTVKEDDDVILPCSLDTNVNIEKVLFDWKKEGTVPQKEVFMYVEGNHYNNGLPGQDEQFRDRVSHFPEELKYGNASIRIKQTKLEDKGIYTCDFPRLQPEPKIFRIELVVEGRLKVRNVPGAAPEPSVTNLDETNDWALLQCDVKGAYPKPTVEWWDSNNQIIPSEELQVSKKGERFYVTLKTTVKKTGRYRCAATQKDIHHQIYKEINVQLNDAVSKPIVRILNDKGSLECEVRGIFPETKVEWWDNDNKTLPSQEEQIKNHPYIIVKATVTKTGIYRCVATQERLNHQIYTETFVQLKESNTGVIIAVAVGVAVAVVLVGAGILFLYSRRNPTRQAQQERNPLNPQEQKLNSDQSEPM